MEMSSPSKYKNIPDELKKIPNWICWQGFEDRPGHLSKRPIDPHSGRSAKTNDSSTWTDFDTAARAAVSYGVNGVGFVFDGSGYFGVDIDNVAELMQDYIEGDADNVVGEFVDTLESYTESSQSGNGIHIICKGKLPEGGRRKDKVEMYEVGRFFVMTGDVFIKERNIRNCTKEIAPLHEKYIGGVKFPEDKRPEMSLDSDIIIRKIRNSSQAVLFDKLYSGNTSGYTSASEADLALCNILCWWSRGDERCIDEIFRKSALMRPKWDEKHGKQTYGQMTIAKALSGYVPRSESRTADSKKPVKVFGMDDLGNGERFAYYYGEDVRYCTIEKKWYMYDDNDGTWNIDRQGLVEAYAKKIVKDYIPQEFEKIALKKENEKADAFEYAANEHNRKMQGLETGYEARKSAVTAEYTAKLESLRAQREAMPELAKSLDEGIKSTEKSLQKELEAAEKDFEKAKNKLDNEYAKECGQIEEAHDSGKEQAKFIKYCLTRKGREQMIKDAMSEVSILPEAFDSNVRFMCFANGVLDLDTMEILPFSKDYYITMKTPYRLDLKSDCPVWKNFLHEFTCHDKGIEHYIQVLCGYSLTGKPIEQLAVFLTGEGNNGKSTFTNVLRDILGDYATTLQSQALMRNKNADSKNDDLLSLKGKRMYVSQESEEGAVLNDAKLKEMTGGDELQGRRLHENLQTFRLIGVLWFMTNHKPIVKDNSVGMWRRMRLIPCNLKLREQDKDPTLPDRLKAEYPAILGWFVEGLRMYRTEGAKTPETVKDASSVYQQEMDTIGQFIDECCDSGGEVMTTQLYSTYAKWARDANLSVMSKQAFGRKIGERFEKRRSDGVWYIGISLKVAEGVTVNY